MIANIDSFIKIFKFYQQNPLMQVRRNFKENSIKYEDTVDIYLNSLILDGDTQLSYKNDSITIQTALNSREKLATYFEKVLYPGSYAYNTIDCAAFRKLILDWSSTIRTIQDSSRHLTDAYSLNSDDLDKALRGFGVDFINTNSLPSTNKRRNFLLNVCNLYSIKGTSESILKALNILGITNAFIREGWMIKNGDDISIDWRLEEKINEFDSESNSWVQPVLRDDMVTSWNWLENKINGIGDKFDCHWLYTKQEILDIYNDVNTYISLPSITPYFGIEFITNIDAQTDALLTIYNDIDEQFRRHLTGTNKQSDKVLDFSDYSEKLSILEAYTALIYSLIRLDDHLMYTNLRSYLESCNVNDCPDATTKYEYFELIYWFYRTKILNKIHAGKNDEAEFAKSVLKNYIPVKSNNYCDYEQLLRWWLLSDYHNDEKNILDVRYYYPTKVSDLGEFTEIEWNIEYPIGRYSVEVYSFSRVTENNDGWLEIEKGCYCFDNTIRKIVRNEDADGAGLIISNFRICYYHTYLNIPDVFFDTPFNLNGNPTDTYLDRTLRYNGPLISLSYYKNDVLKNAFNNQKVVNDTDTYDVISGYHKHETLDSKIRTTDIHDDLQSMYNSAMNYPTLTRLYEDKWMNINNDFYNYVDWSIKGFTDTQKHNGILENERNTKKFGDLTQLRKWPVNYKWNWAVDSKYYYLCYESNKWCRFEYDSIDSNIDVRLLLNDANVPTISYGESLFVNNKLYINVAPSTYIIFDNPIFDWAYDDGYLLNDGKIKVNSPLSKDYAVAKIVDENNLEYIYQDCTTSLDNPIRSEIVKALNSENIEIIKDPYSSNPKHESFNYKKFLNYLYNARLTLDFNTGYIYPVSKYYKDDKQIAIKCLTGTKVTDIKWVKLRPQYKWNLDIIESANGVYTVKENDSVYQLSLIYSDWEFSRTIDQDGDVKVTKISNGNNLGYLLPQYTFKNRYDSLRFLDGPLFKTYDELVQASNNDTIPPDIMYVLVKPNSSSSYPTIYKRVDSYDASTNKVVSKWELSVENKIYDTNFGINPKLVDFIESRYAQDDQYYIGMVNDLNECINSYISDVYEIEDAMTDLTIANMTTSGVITKTINFYKPKRTRMLFISNTLEGEYGLNNNLDSLNICDYDYNYYDLSEYKWYEKGFNKREFSKMNRQRISHVIDDYLPLEDVIFKSKVDDNQIYSYRELFEGESNIPSMKVYDKLLSLNTQNSGNTPASFYVGGFSESERMNGFYYKLDNQDIYTNNSYYFAKCVFMFHGQDNNINVTIRWALFSTNDTTTNYGNAKYVADSESELPWINVLSKKAVKYAINRIPNTNVNATEKWIYNPKYIDNLVYDEATFYSEGDIELNPRTLEPVFYFNNFDDNRCNGFYYHDETMYPNRNNQPVYFNTNGKILSFIDTTGYFSVDDNGRNISKFWIITDNRQYVDFSDNDYFALCDNNDTTIWFKFYPDYTKDFHKSTDAKINKISRGYSIGFVIDNPGVIRIEDRNRYAIYDNYENGKQNNFNTVTQKHQPLGYVKSNNRITRNYFDVIDMTQNNISYDRDKIGNYLGAIKICKDNGSSINFNNSIIKNNLERTISFLAKYKNESDIIDTFGENSNIEVNKWNSFTLISDVNYDYYVNECISKHYEKGIESSNSLAILIIQKQNGIEALENQKKLESDKLQREKDIALKYTSSEEARNLINIRYNKLFAELDAKYETELQNCINEYNNEISQELLAIKETILNFASIVVSENDNKTYERTISDIFNSILIDNLNVITIDDTYYCKELNDAFNIFSTTTIDISQLTTQVLEEMVKTIGITNRRSQYDEFNTFYVNGEINNTCLHKDICFDHCKFENVDVLIDEYGVWDSVLSKWYIGVINNFGILRSRQEPQKSKTSKSKNSYQPLYALETPRIVFGRYNEGIPENTTGGRLDKYNADCALKDIQSEANPLWKKYIPENVNSKLIVKDGTTNHPKRMSVNDGETLISSKHYKADDRIASWWIRKDSEYETGPVNHRPVYISLQEKVNDAYPFISKGQEEKNGDYYDVNLAFDGINNRDTSFYDGEKVVIKNDNRRTYYTEPLDEVTTYDSDYHRYILTGDISPVDYATDRNPVKFQANDFDGNQLIKEATDWYHRYYNFSKRIIKRVTEIDNNGDTFNNDSCKDSLIVPDLDQYFLNSDNFSNGIYHETLSYYTNKPEWSKLNGKWIHKSNNPCFIDGDFDECYEKDNMIAVLTYQRQSGYFWWEIRENNGVDWTTIARTYVKPTFNQNRKMIWMDYVNWNQIDLASQKLCIFNENDYEVFANTSWGEIKQDIIDESRFTCGKWLEIPCIECPDMKIASPSNSDIYYDGEYVFFRNKEEDRWFKITIKAEENKQDARNEYIVTTDSDGVQHNELLVIPAKVNFEMPDCDIPVSGFIYKNGYLYCYLTDDKLWVRIQANSISDYIENNKYFEQWKFYNTDDNTVVINILDASDIDNFDMQYINPGTIDIRETCQKLIKFNDLAPFDWSKHMGEDFKYLKSVNNNISLSRCSLKDAVYVFVWQKNDDGSKLLLMPHEYKNSEIIERN